MQRLLLTLMAVGCMAAANAQGLKDAVGKYCLIGAAINQWQSDGQVPEADADHRSLRHRLDEARKCVLNYTNNCTF